MANALLEKLVRDHGPTPQVAPRSDGGLQIEWLVSDDSVSADVYPDGTVVLIAEDADGNTFVDAEFAAWETDNGAIEEAGRLLDKMAFAVERRAPIR